MLDSPRRLVDMAEDLRRHVDVFGEMFICHRTDNTAKAHQYVCGLLQSDRRNMERMEEAVEGADYEALQQFISNSPWDSRAVMNRVAAESDKLLGGTGRTALLLDETAILKKGKASVGVSRQWNGRYGKVDNSQVGVFGALCAGDRVIPIDAELFLPERWTNDAERCRKAGVPEERIRHRAKPELALEIVRRQRRSGIRFDWVCADGLYGNGFEFCKALDDDGEVFVLHVHSDRLVYPEDVRATDSRSPSGVAESVRVDQLFKTAKESEIQRVKVRETTTGALEVDALRRPVLVRDEEEQSFRRWTLYVRRDVSEAGEIKYCLTNAAESVPTSVVAAMEAQRFWIERSFEDAKSQAGMAEYQVRGWRAWHHHMALVMMTMLFMTKQRMLYEDEHPLLSCYDIKVLLVHFLPSRKNTTAEILRQMQKRHAKRRAASENAARRRQVAADSAGSP